MGLDMYLSKKIYIGANYEHRKVKGSINVQIDGRDVPISFNKITYIMEEGCYWRKANMIHRWFVENVQDYEDDCKEYDVSKEQLEELLALCKETIANPAKAEETLPTASGFFFGGTEYDDNYMADLEDTVKMLEELLASHTPDADYSYHSSW